MSFLLCTYIKRLQNEDNANASNKLFKNLPSRQYEFKEFSQNLSAMRGERVGLFVKDGQKALGIGVYHEDRWFKKGPFKNS